MKSKAATGAPDKQEKQKGLALFGQKPPTPKLLKVFGNLRKGGLLDKLKVRVLADVESDAELLVNSSLLFAERGGGSELAARRSCPSCGVSIF